MPPSASSRSHVVVGQAFLAGQPTKSDRNVWAGPVRIRDIDFMMLMVPE
jgi:hypothetical protein